MDAGALWTIVRDYAGVLIGLGVLVAAVSVLPGRAKWYVLTAGLAILGYEAYLRTRNRKLLAEADKEREVLRERATELGRRSADLQKSVEGLNRQLEENRQRLMVLDREAADLSKRGGDISEAKAKLDEETRRRSEENEALLREAGGHEELLSALRDAQHALNRMD